MLSRPHLALRENPEYFNTLGTLHGIAADSLTTDITEAEVAKTGVNDIRVVDTDQFLRAANVLFKPNIEDLPKAVQALMAGRLLRTFLDHALGHQLELEGIAKRLDTNGGAGLQKTNQALAMREGDMTRLMPGGFDLALPYAVARSLVANRLRSDEVQRDVFLGLGGERLDGNKEYDELVRVITRPPKTPSHRYAMEAFIEGYETIAHAGFQLEKGGAQGITVREDDFARAILKYAHLVPYSGLLTPMSMRGEYFENLVDPSGNIQEPYKRVFMEMYSESTSSGGHVSPETLYEEDYFPPIDFDWSSLSPQQRDNYNRCGFPPAMYVPEPNAPYAGEGCPGVYFGIIVGSAKIFSRLVRNVLDMNLPVPPVEDFSGVIRRSEAIDQSF